MIGWHVNRGWNQEADFFVASQLRGDYNRPDIVRLVLQTRDEAEAVRRANAASGRNSVPRNTVQNARRVYTPGVYCLYFIGNEHFVVNGDD